MKKKLAHKGRAIEMEMRTHAPPRQVWDAWADPARVTQWFTDGASGEAVEGSTLTWTFEKFGLAIPYTVAAAAPGEQFALHFAGEVGGVHKEGILEVTIEHAGGETVMRLVNSGFREASGWDDEYEGIHSGWHNALAILRLYLERHYGRAKTLSLAMRPVAAGYERIRPLYRDQVSRWLTLGGTIGTEGEPVLLELRDHGMLTGTVLAAAATEVTVEWREIGGTLELKAFGAGEGRRMVGLRALSWNGDRGLPGELEGKFAEALERLAGLLG